MGKNNLERTLGLKEAVTLVIGMVIGSGIFFKPSIVFHSTGSKGLGILAWIIGGVITIAAGLTIGELSSAIPETGGLFIYLKRLYGEKWAFLFGWVETLIYVPGSTAALAIIFSSQAASFMPMNGTEQKILAVALILFIAIVNCISTQFGGKLQLVSTITKLIPIFIIIIGGLVIGHHSGSTAASSVALKTNLSAAILGTLWAYDGWINVSNMAGELKNSERTLPLSIIIGLLSVMGVYILINLAILNVLPFSSIVSSKTPASDAAILMFGKYGAAIITIGILISILGALNGYFMTGARIPFAMSQDKLLPFHKVLGKVNDKTLSPVNSLIFELVLASIYTFSGSFDTLTNLSVFVLWIFFTMANFGVFILRKKKIPSKYRVPLFPVVPIIGIGGGLYILINTILTDTSNALFGIAVTLIGLPVYFYIKKKGAH